MSMSQTTLIYIEQFITLKPRKEKNVNNKTLDFRKTFHLVNHQVISEKKLSRKKEEDHQ